MLILPSRMWAGACYPSPASTRTLRIGCWILCTDNRRSLQAAAAWRGVVRCHRLGASYGDALVRAPSVVFGPPGIIYACARIVLFRRRIATFFLSAAWVFAPPEDELTTVEDETHRSPKGWRRFRSRWDEAFSRLE